MKSLLGDQKTSATNSLQQQFGHGSERCNYASNKDRGTSLSLIIHNSNQKDRESRESFLNAAVNKDERWLQK